MNKDSIIRELSDASDHYENCKRAFEIARKGMDNASHRMSEAESAWREYRRGEITSPFIPQFI